MTLGDVLSITSEFTDVNVVDYESNEIISSYDGKNSIDLILNFRKVVRQYVHNNKLHIIIL